MQKSFERPSAAEHLRLGMSKEKKAPKADACRPLEDYQNQRQGMTTPRAMEKPDKNYLQASNTPKSSFLDPKKSAKR